MAATIARITKALEPLFRERGFARKGNSFVRKNEHFWLIVNWQKSTDSAPGQTKFTINIGVHDLRLAGLEGETLETPPDVWRCHYRTRLGRLMSENDDKWWTVLNGVSEDSAVVELADAIRAYLLPFFVKFRIPEALLNIWKTGQSPGQTNAMREKFIGLLEEHS